MKTVEITYEITFRISESYKVTDEEYQDIYEGMLPERIDSELSHEAYSKGDVETDWTATDEETGKVLQDWR